MNEQLREEQKQVAINIMEKLDIYKPYIRAFKTHNTITLYEQYGGYYIEEDSDLYKAIKAFEEKYNCLVYSVTHEFTPFGECYDYLIVPQYKEEWADLISISNGKQNTLFAYVVNKDDEFCSEFGDITINSFGGGIKRIA